MANPRTVRESTELYPEDWEALDTLADEIGAVATAGPKTGEPSWRTLIREIARGDVLVARRLDAAEIVRMQMEPYLEELEEGSRKEARQQLEAFLDGLGDQQSPDV